jgi:hypothetical protein
VATRRQSVSNIGINILDLRVTLYSIVVITNIRTVGEYYQQTSISLMYASRAKKVRNKSVLNRNIVGDTGIHAVTEEIERLRFVSKMFC